MALHTPVSFRLHIFQEQEEFEIYLYFRSSYIMVTEIRIEIRGCGLLEEIQRRLNGGKVTKIYAH